MMNIRFTTPIAATLASLLLPTAALATVVPFTENYTADASSWRDGSGAVSASWTAAGGPDGSSYISTGGTFENNLAGDTPIFARGHDTYGSSGLAFVGDWLSDGVAEFSAYVRHDAPAPLNYFVRFAKPSNFPAAIGVEFVPVFPNTWTRIDIAIDASNPEFVNFETSDFNTIFSGIGKLQIGVTVPAGLAGSPLDYTFDFDQIAIVPEPSAALLVGVALLGAVGSRRSVRSA